MQPGPTEQKAREDDKVIRRGALLASIPTISVPESRAIQAVEQSITTFGTMRSIGGGLAVYVRNEAFAYGNQIVKENAPLIENMVCNTILLTGKEIGYAYGATVSSAISDWLENKSKSTGVDFLLNQITGYSIGYMLSSSFQSLDQAQQIKAITNVLSTYCTQGAHQAFVEALTESIALNFGPEVTGSVFSKFQVGVYKFQTKQTIAKPVTFVAGYNSTFDSLKQAAECIPRAHKQVKQVLMDNVTTPVIDYVYENGAKDAVVSFWANLASTGGEYSAQYVNSNYIEGNLSRLICNMADIYFPQPYDAITANEAANCMDLTDNTVLVRQLKDKERARARVAHKIQEKGSEMIAAQGINLSLTSVLDTVKDAYKAVLPFDDPNDSILNKIIKGEKLTDEDLKRIDEIKAKNESTGATIGRNAAYAFVTIGQAIANTVWWNHEKEAKEIVALLNACRLSYFKPEDVKKLKQAVIRLEGYKETYPRDIAIIKAKITNSSCDAIIDVICLCDRIFADDLKENWRATLDSIISVTTDSTQLGVRGVSPMQVAISKISDQSTCLEVFKKMHTSRYKNNHQLTKLGMENLIHLCAYHNQPAVIDFLLHENNCSQEEKDILLNDETALFDTPMHLAVKRGNKEAFIKLLDLGADITVENDDFKTPLDVVQNKLWFNDAQIKEALNRRLKLNLEQEKNGPSKSQEAEKRLLIIWGASPSQLNLTNEYFQKLLHEGSNGFAFFLVMAIAKEKNIEPSVVFKEIFPDKTHVNMLNKNGDPLIIAALKDANYTFAKFLLDAGSNPYLPNKDGLNALQYYNTTSEIYSRVSSAYEKGGFSALGILYYGEQDRQDFQVGLNATLGSSEKSLEYLTQDQINIKSISELLADKTKSKEAILEEISQFQKSSSDFLNKQDLHGNTLLHHAFTCSRWDICLWLLEHGASPFIPNTTNYSFQQLWYGKDNYLPSDATRLTQDASRAKINDIMKSIASNQLIEQAGKDQANSRADRGMPKPIENTKDLKK